MSNDGSFLHMHRVLYDWYSPSACVHLPRLIFWNLHCSSRNESMFYLTMSFTHFANIFLILQTMTTAWASAGNVYHVQLSAVRVLASGLPLHLAGYVPPAAPSLRCPTAPCWTCGASPAEAHYIENYRERWGKRLFSLKWKCPKFLEIHWISLISCFIQIVLGSFLNCTLWHNTPFTPLIMRFLHNFCKGQCFLWQ